MSTPHDHGRHPEGSMDPGRSFDERAATWDDDPGKVARARAVATSIRAALPLDSSMRMLELGAGTGLLSEALRDSVGSITLTDTSAGMREVMERKVTSGALPAARVWDLDLATDPLPDERFDLIVSLMALHHIADTDALLANVAALLEPGGHVCIVDLDAEDGSFHGHGFEGHRGFDRDVLRDKLDAAGLIDVHDCHDVERDSGTFSLFLATAAKPAATSERGAPQRTS